MKQYIFLLFILTGLASGIAQGNSAHNHQENTGINTVQKICMAARSAERQRAKWYYPCPPRSLGLRQNFPVSADGLTAGRLPWKISKGKSC